MRSFESFKASRMKMDPSARTMSNHQWEQAYTAYKRVRGHQKKDTQESTESSEVSPRLPLDDRLLVLRQNTAYPQARKYVDWVFFSALAYIVIVFLVTVYQALADNYLGMLLVSLIKLVFSLGLSVLLRELAHVWIDIPDIALNRVRERQAVDSQED